MKLTTIIWILATIWIVVALIATPTVVPTETDYNYDVKVEQAYDVDRVDDSDVTEFENLSEDEQAVLYEAFKEIETGSMFGENGAEVQVTFDEQQATFSTWRSVEVNGIVLLVAVEETVTERADTSVWWVEYWFYSLIGAVLISFFGIFMLGP